MSNHASVLRNSCIEQQFANQGARRSSLVPVPRSIAVLLRCGPASMWFAIILLCLLGLLPSRVWATCSYANGTTAITIPVVLQGTITVGRDAPVGTEIYRTYVHSNQIVAVTCDEVSPFNFQYISLPYPKANYTDPVYGNNVYQTNVPGVGVVGWAGDPPKAMPASFNSSIVGTTTVNTDWYYFSFIKIGPVSAGTITGASLPTLQYVVGSNNLRLQLGGATGSLSIIAQTCTTPNVSVNLGTHFTTELSGVGTTTNQWVSVPIALNNCPAFFGYTSTSIDDGVTTPGLLGQNSILYSVTPNNGVADATNGVMNLSSGGATGIGIQLTDTSSKPVQFNTATPSGLTLNETNSANYTINLQARYYQTGTSITAGAANATATVTLTYL
jgi:type 1 fimbria pilin/uncharacterized membrane protein YqaE (UPF0057 family)